MDDQIEELNLAFEELQDAQTDLQEAKKNMEKEINSLDKKIGFVGKRINALLGMVHDKKRKRVEEQLCELNLDSLTLDNFKNPTRKQADLIAEHLIRLFKFKEAKFGANKFLWSEIGKNAGPASEEHPIHQSVLDAIEEKTDVEVLNANYSLTFSIRLRGPSFAPKGTPIEPNVTEDDFEYSDYDPEFNFETPMDRIMNDPEAYCDIVGDSGEAWMKLDTEGEVYEDCELVLILDDDFSWQKKKHKSLLD